MLFLNTSLSLTRFKLNRYNPYINYSWSQTLTVGGNQHIKDTGTAGLNLQQFFGQGCWLNGVDNYLNNVCQTGIRNNTGSFMVSVSNITSNPNLKVFGGINTHRTWIGHRNGYLLIGIGDVSSIIVCPLESVMQVVLNYDNFNYEVYVNNQLKKTGTYTVAITENRPIEIGGLGSNFYVSAVIKDVYMFNRPLTPIEIEKYTNQPNQFFMDSLEDSSCVLAMPMCEKDGFVRNYKSYSYSSFLINNIGLKSSTHANTRIAQVVAGLLVQAGKTYLIKYSFIDNGSISHFKAYIPPTSNGGTVMNVEVAITSTNKEFIVTIPTTYTNTDGGFYYWLAVNGTSISVNFDEVSIREISGIYPITNYLTTCRTNAQRLPYGLQTSGFKRDTNGLILSKSNFLEADGVGYGNTGWVPKWDEDFTVESVFEVSNYSEFRLNGNNYSDGIYFGNNSVGKNLYVRVFGSTVIQIANTKDIVCLIFSYNWQTKEVKQYVDGVLVTTQLATKTTNSPLPVLLGMVAIGGTNYPIIKPIRLLKVHNKVLTQEEITKNFNKYQAQGLLNE